jgi:hypothetical protein
MRVAVLTIVLFACFAGAASARGNDHGGDRSDIRVTGTCGPGATSTLRVRSRDDGIEVRFQLRQTRRLGRWRVTIVHENRVVVRAVTKTSPASGTFELRRTLPDLPGSDTVVVHAWGPSGIVCGATATLPDTP